MSDILFTVFGLVVFGFAQLTAARYVHEQDRRRHFWKYPNTWRPGDSTMPFWMYALPFFGNICMILEILTDAHKGWKPIPAVAYELYKQLHPTPELEELEAEAMRVLQQRAARAADYANWTRGRR